LGATCADKPDPRAIASAVTALEPPLLVGTKSYTNPTGKNP
jgi:hypothetical protein